MTAAHLKAKNSKNLFIRKSLCVLSRLRILLSGRRARDMLSYGSEWWGKETFSISVFGNPSILLGGFRGKKVPFETN